MFQNYDRCVYFVQTYCNNCAVLYFKLETGINSNLYSIEILPIFQNILHKCDTFSYPKKEKLESFPHVTFEEPPRALLCVEQLSNFIRPHKTIVTEIFHKVLFPYRLLGRVSLVFNLGDTSNYYPSGE